MKESEKIYKIATLIFKDKDISFTAPINDEGKVLRQRVKDMLIRQLPKNCVSFKCTELNKYTGECSVEFDGMEIKAVLKRPNVFNII